MMSLLSKLAVWLAKLVREVNFANAVMRVPKMRVRHSGPARGTGPHCATTRRDSAQ